PGSNPNEAMDARIRGLRTISYNFGNTQPLYVVDGVPGVGLFAVDPSDIVAVDVLRDAASTAIYGGRGTNGVVVITTRPTETSPLKILYQGQISLESTAKRYTLFDETQFLAAGGDDLSPGFVVNTDWQDEVLQTAVSHAHHLSATKGLGHGFIKGGLHYRDVTGIMRESGFEQYNGNLQGEQRFWHDRLRLSAGANLGQRSSNYGFPEAYRYAINFSPSSPVRSDDAQYVPYGGYVNNTTVDFFNPVAMLEQNHHSGRTDFHLLHARAELLVLPNLRASVQVSDQLQSAHNLEYYSPYSKFRGAGIKGYGQTNSQKTRQKTLESTLTYRFQRGDWQADLLGGYGWYHNQVNTTFLLGENLLDNTWKGKTWDQYRDLLKNFPSIYPYYENAESRSDRQLIAFFGRAQLQWRDTYFGTFSWRKEGSSNLSPATRWGVFPGISLGVDVNQFMPSRPFDYFKISFGHGVTGSELTHAGLYQRTFSQGPKFYYNGQFVPSYGIIQNPNDQLGWERSTENSLNLRFALWSGRLQVSANTYRYHSRDLITTITAPIPPNFSSNTVKNVGEISGRGVELSLSYQLVKNQNWNWELGLSANKSESTLENAGFFSPYDSLSYSTAGYPCGCGTFLQLLYPGATVGTFWGPIAAGINAQGFQTFEDLNGDGSINADQFNRDQTRLGDAQPTWQLGLQQKLTWRNLDLSMLLQAVTGHQLYHYYRHAYETNYSTAYNRLITRYFDPALRYAPYSNRLIEDGSFLRMQYLSLGYRLPLHQQWLHSLHFQIGAQNLFTLSKYTGLDPDLRLRDTGPFDNGGRPTEGYGDPLAPGIDRGSYPTARRFWLGVEAAF
ncbi:MAG: SusC/RagA family TonB-linked outer membrane protein, partial [Saprospiraceae bacterium]